MLPMYIEARSTYYVRRIIERMTFEKEVKNEIKMDVPKIKYLL